MALLSTSGAPCGRRGRLGVGILARWSASIQIVPDIELALSPGPVSNVDCVSSSINQPS
jgi:hypothetical protein